VVLGLDDAAGGAALAGDVEVDELAAFVLHGDGCVDGRTVVFAGVLVGNSGGGNGVGLTGRRARRVRSPW
jgi:hypothetical protein